ncbi:MAG: surface-adhesin E family protein [Sulfuricella sp.]
MRFCFFGLALFLSMPALASDWQSTYYNTRKGSLLIDKDSIVEAQGNVKKFWTLFAPRVTVGQPSEGYAYHKALRQIDCASRTSSLVRSIYHDESNVQHEAKIDDKTMREIVPDSEDDYLWQYVCKPERQDKLGIATGNISQFLDDQVKFTKENLLTLKRMQGK